MLLGAVLTGAGLMLTSMAGSVVTFALSFGLLCGCGVALLGMPANFVLLSERFQNRVATAMGAAAIGIGLGVLVVIPFLQWGADRAGWRSVFWRPSWRGAT